MVTVAVRALAAVGVNVRLRRQLAPATTVAPFVQVVPAAMAKSPGFEPARTMLVMLRVAVPLLVRVTVCTGLVVLRRWSPKARLVGAEQTAELMSQSASDSHLLLDETSSVMVTVAVRALAAVGVNVRLIRQLFFFNDTATTEIYTLSLHDALPIFEPARTMLVMLRVAVPLLVRVTVCTGLVVLRRWSPKARLVGAKVTAGTIPVPASDTDRGLPGASSVMVTVAVRALAAVGVNVRLRRQLAPTTTVAPFVQVVPAAMAKSPGFKPARAMLVMLRVAVPLLVRVTVCAGLVVLRRWSPKARLVGAMVTAGATPVTASHSVCGVLGVSSVMVTVAVRAPVAAGVKLMLIVQLAPGATEPAPVGQVLPAAKAKSAACAPVMVMLVRFSGVPPLLVSVRFCAALVVPTR